MDGHQDVNFGMVVKSANGDQYSLTASVAMDTGTGICGQPDPQRKYGPWNVSTEGEMVLRCCATIDAKYSACSSALTISPTRAATHSLIRVVFSSRSKSS